MNSVHFSSSTDLWSTPQDLFDDLNHLYHFTLDVCAIADNAKCKVFFSPLEDGLNQNWFGRVWCNPPYGRQIKYWIRKGYEYHLNGGFSVFLVPARTDTTWFHEYIYNQDRVKIIFLKGRLKFGGSKNSAPFPSMLVIFEGICYNV